MTDKRKNQIAGAAGGLASGLFGGGGGMILLPLLVKWRKLEGRKSFATCVAIILPMCCVSAAVYLWQVRPAWGTLWPYLAGGTAGGLLGGMTFDKVPVRILKNKMAREYVKREKAGAEKLVYGGVRYLLW